jgi:hypothetical protein
MTAALGKALRAFGHFWWDFLIGDTPELAVATLLTAAFLLASAWRGRRAPGG